MQDDHRDQNFEIIGIDTEEQDTADDINAFAKEMKLNYTLVWGDADLQNELVKITNFPGIPQSFLIARDGRIIKRFVGFSREKTPPVLREAVEAALKG